MKFNGFGGITEMNTGKAAYFAAANTAAGFYSQFPKLFDPACGKWQRIYIIKGGPGTGKSSFMRRAAKAAEEKGLAVEYFHCSADPGSLDGIRIPSRGIAMLDGTAPHTVDASYPGSVEQIVDLGMFFDTDALREKRDVLRRLFDEHASHHITASRYLRAAGAMRENETALLSSAFLRKKALDAARRLVRHLPAEREPIVLERFVTAICARGTVHLPTAEQCGTCVYVTDGGRAALFFDAMLDAVNERGLSYTRYASPLRPTETEGIYLPACDTVWFTDRYGRAADNADTRPLNTARFLDPSVTAARRTAIRFAAKCGEALLDGAASSLSEASRVHDMLESHYTAAMDFDAMNRYIAHFLCGFC